MLSRYFIVRISWLFGLNGRNFVNSILRLGSENKRISVVNDQIGSPTFADDLSPLLVTIVSSDRYGIYHATNEGYCTRAEFAELIIKKAGLPAEIVPIDSATYGSIAKRPCNSMLSKKKLSQNGFTRLPDYEDAVSRYLKQKGYS
jgi:dTDP-4-dehydrorhamnose reductase